MLEFMLFAHEPETLKLAWESGIERIVIDWETRNKQERQSGYHLEQNYLAEADLVAARKAFPGVLVCRINPVHGQSRSEIDRAIGCGADILMLPMFRTVQEVETFWELTAGRAKTMLLFETKESISVAAALGASVVEAYVGLNDLSLSMGQKFAFQPLEKDIVGGIRSHMPAAYFGFGAITVLGGGAPLETRLILTELARLQCNVVILRRAFKRDAYGKNWKNELDDIRSEYGKLLNRSCGEIAADRAGLLNRIREIVS